jgi:Ca2+-dependent lipid-binding protein
MDDLELQDEPLQIRIMDHDTYSANDAIGKVYLDLNPLLIASSAKAKGTYLILQFKKSEYGSFIVIQGIQRWFF